ncbi:MAG: NAD(P)-binding protein [Myxococcales bacterium]|nr:NAD(P)-binding protein [Myxococcales bacterium]
MPTKRSRAFPRRAFLGSAAASGLVGLACGAGPAPPAGPPLIELVGPDPARGHLLRDGGLDGPIARSEDHAIVIVGAGAAGLAAAWRLWRAGFDDYVVVELEDAIGGTARSGELPRSPHPMGAHYLPAPHPECRALEALLDDLGLVLGRDAAGRAEYLPSAQVCAPEDRHFRGHRWHEGLYPGEGEDAAEAEAHARWRDHLAALDRRGSDGRRLFRLPVARSSAQLRGLDRLTMAEHLQNLGVDPGAWRLRWAIDYACRDDYGCTIDQVSAFAGLHYHLARGLDDHRPILTWPGGNGHLVRSIAERVDLAPRLRAGTAAVAIDPDAGEVITHRLLDGERRRLRARAILWAAPRFVLPRLLPPGRDPLPSGALTYAPWLVASVEVDRRPRGLGAPPAWDNVPIDHTSLGYVVATHGEDRSETRPGAVLTYYEPLPGADAEALAARRRELLEADAATLAARVEAGLSVMHPGIGGAIRRMAITRWGHAMIRPVPGLLFGDALALARAPIGRLRPCATDVAGLPLFEEAFYAGAGAAEAALAELGRAGQTLIADDLEA